MSQEHVVTNAKSNINLSYPFDMHNAGKLREKVATITNNWNALLASEEASLFTENHVLSIIYQLIENPDFKFKDIGGRQVCIYLRFSFCSIFRLWL